MIHFNKKFTSILFCMAMLPGLQTLATDDQKPDGAPARPQLPPVNVTVAKSVELEETGMRRYIGMIEAIEDVSIIARISGFIEKIAFKEGEIIKKGDLLFELEDTTYQAQVKSSEAKVDQLKAELTYAQSNFERQEGLERNNIVSRDTLEDAERLLNFRKAGLAEAEATLVDAKNNLSYTKIYSPITGKVGKATYTLGNYVTLSSSPLADIVKIAPIYVRFAISENDYLSLFGNAETIKNEAVVRVQTADKKIYNEVGKITLVDNKIDTSTGTIMVWATFENADFKLNPGGLVTAFLTKKTGEKKTAVRISALQTDLDGNFLYVVDSENKANIRRVTPGEVLNNMQIISKGLEPGEMVVVDGTHKIVIPGRTIIPVPEENAN